MNLKDIIASDIEDIFFNFDEMAEKRLIDDVETDCIFIIGSTYSRKGKRGTSKIDGSSLYLRDDKETYEKYKPNKSLDIDSSSYIITNRSKEFGLIKLKLEESEGF